MTWQGGIARGIGIKVDIMVPACCESNPGGSIADPSFQKRLFLTSYAAEVWPER